LYRTPERDVGCAGTVPEPASPSSRRRSASTLEETPPQHACSARNVGTAGWGRYYLSRQSALSLRHRELVIDRTTALCGADYEWGVHVSAFAVKAGLTGPQVRSLGGGQPDDSCWDDPADRAVLRAVDELHASSDLTDEGWDRLADAVGEDGALDLLLLCGWYHAISFTVRALRLPMEPGTGPIPA
jgi:hypothetical protein